MHAPSKRGSRWLSAGLVSVSMLGASGAYAGTVTGKLDLPPTRPDRAKLQHRGFLGRVENPLAHVQDVDPLPWMFVSLEGGPMTSGSIPPQVVWQLVGESFAQPVVPVVVGTDVQIKNMTHTARILTATDMPDLLPKGPLNPGGSKTFHVTEAGKVVDVHDSSSPHLRGRVVVLASRYFATLKPDGSFEIPDVPAGNWTVKVWFASPQGPMGYLDRVDETITVTASGKTDVKPKIPGTYAVRGAAGAATDGKTK